MRVLHHEGIKKTTDTLRSFLSIGNIKVCPHSNTLPLKGHVHSNKDILHSIDTPYEIMGISYFQLSQSSHEKTHTWFSVSLKIAIQSFELQGQKHWISFLFLQPTSKLWVHIKLSPAYINNPVSFHCHWFLSISLSYSYSSVFMCS